VLLLNRSKSVHSNFKVVAAKISSRYHTEAWIAGRQSTAYAKMRPAVSAKPVIISSLMQSPTHMYPTHVNHYSNVPHASAQPPHPQHPQRFAFRLSQSPKDPSHDGLLQSDKQLVEGAIVYSKGVPLILGRQLGSPGGEGTVFEVDSKTVAKI
jgi:hypothetical protein